MTPQNTRSILQARHIVHLHSGWVLFKSPVCLSVVIAESGPDYFYLTVFCINSKKTEQIFPKCSNS